MGNIWSWTLQFPADAPISANTVERALEVAAEQGYVIQQLLMFDGEGDERWFDDVSALCEALVQDGGIMVLWSGEDSLEFGVWTRHGHIDIGKSNDLRADRPEDVRVAADAERIFLALCDALHPFYGYSADYYLVESVLQESFLAEWDMFEQDVREGKAPHLLFWLNYFSAEFVSRIGRDHFASLPATLTERSHGIVLRLASHPWEAKMAIRQNDGSYTIA